MYREAQNGVQNIAKKDPGRVRPWKNYKGKRKASMPTPPVRNSNKQLLIPCLMEESEGQSQVSLGVEGTQCDTVT